MDEHGDRGRPSHRPLLLNFIRRQPDSDVRFRYDAEKSLNVTTPDDIPVVVVAPSMLKTQAQTGGED
jgi:hypothetical protein